MSTGLNAALAEKAAPVSDEQTRRHHNMVWGTEMPMTRDQYLMAWQESQKQAAYWKAKEAAQRSFAADLIFAADTRKTGMNTIELGGGYKLKANFKLNYRLDSKEDSAATDAALDRIEKIGNDGPFVVQRLVKWKPELSVSEYKLLSDDHKKEIDKVLTVSPSLVEMEIIEPPKGK